MQRDLTRYKNLMQRCNLYVKDLPPSTTEEQLYQYFSRYGEVLKLKIITKEGQAIYAFVCFKSPDSAILAKQQAATNPFNGQQLYINFYVLSGQRKNEQDQQRDI